MKIKESASHIQYAVMNTSKPVITALLILITVLSACSKEEENLAQYSIAGTILDKQTSLPISNIRVVRTGYQLLLPDTCYSDIQGKFSFQFTDFYSATDKPVTVTATDIDGNENGGIYKLFSMDVIFATSDWEKNPNSSTFKGIAKKNITIKMTK